MISIIVLIFVSRLRISTYRIIEPFCIRARAVGVFVGGRCSISSIFCTIAAVTAIFKCFFELARIVGLAGFILSMLRCSILITSHTPLLSTHTSS